MFDSQALYLVSATGFAAILVLASATWLLSLALKNVSIVDSIWSMLIILPAVAAIVLLPESGPRALIVLALAGLWAIRLAGYITWRNWGAGEDHRYREIRARNQPHFEWKSLYLVFALQGVLAWMVSIPLVAAIASPRPLGWLDALGITVFVVGFLFESLGDLQLARFRANPANRDKVLDYGLWRYTRHPNYFGEFCIWWGFYLMSLSAGAWWAFVSPLLMSILLLKISGVTLLERDIGLRRPAYQNYVARTNAFFPGLFRK
jgi:steroid 5-alpha reductase family enzyme